MFAKYELDPAKKTILFVSSFSVIGLQKSEEAILSDDYKRMERVINFDSQRIIVNWFKIFLLSHPNYQIVYRAHPSEAENMELMQVSETIKNFFVISQDTIRNWIMNCDILCNWLSTSMIEMFVSGKKTLLLRPISIPNELDICIFKEGFFRAIETYEQFCEAILDDKVLYPFPVKAEDLLYFYDITNEPSYQRVSDYLIDTYNDTEYRSIRINLSS